MVSVRVVTALVAGLAVAALSIGTQAQKSGSITFPTSGAPAAQAEFLNGVKALHNFEFDQAAVAFQKAQQADPGFAMAYAPDHRQAYADSWPRSIDDSAARADWGWKPQYDLRGMVDDMMANLRRTVAA